jgi:hypothetical protein
MDAKRMVPDSPVPTAVASAVVSLFSIVIVYGIGHATTDLIFRVVWLPLNVIETVIAWYVYQLSRKDTSFLPLLPWAPVLQQVVNRLAEPFAPRQFAIYVLVVGIAQALYFILLYKAVRLAFIDKRTEAAVDGMPSSRIETLGEPGTGAEISGIPAELQTITLEQAVHIRVTDAVRQRSRQTSETARLSMIIMIVLVLLGGGASVGLWFVGQLDRVRSLELERKKLVYLSSQFTGQSDRTPQELSKALIELQKVVRDNYTQEQSYQSLLREISASMQTSWPDIAIRATIAVLTLFLVQIFFAVYKYSQHLSNLLAAKAEALELVGVAEQDRRQLRKEMISLAKERTPTFGAGPNTPLQELLDLLEKLKKAKPE